MRPKSAQGVLSERTLGNLEIGGQDDLSNRAKLRDMIARSQAPVATFARFMGVSRRAIYQYLSGKRPTPNVAISTARFALFVMGVSFEIPGDEIRRNLGFRSPWTPQRRQEIAAVRTARPRGD
jgi:transcriptional regulator with XRE-family HTH domain